MLTKRVIPCLDIKDGRTVKGINFIKLRDAGDPVELASQYAQENADENIRALAQQVWDDYKHVSYTHLTLPTQAMV